jgi:hypothetical protein
MYCYSIWESVTSIQRKCTSIFIPNPSSTSFLLMYFDVLRLTIILGFNAKSYVKLVLDYEMSSMFYPSLVDKRWWPRIHWTRAVSG